ncbi:MAG TPA: pectinesterase family protein, partial [Phycisphaerae bacterium]
MPLPKLASSTFITLLLALSVQARAADTLKTSSLFPESNTKDISPDVQLKIDFPSAPKLGTGKIQIFDAAGNTLIDAIDAATPTKSQNMGGMQVYYPVTISGTQATIHFKNHALAYGKSYYVTLDPGVFTDTSGASSAITGADAWKFSTRAAPPKAGAALITIAPDNSGDFCTLQAALDFIPDNNTAPTTVLLKKGTYTEMIFLRNKANITLLGEDRQQSVIAYSNTSKINQRRSVMQINNCNDFVMSNLTVWNTTPKLSGGNQAETIIYGGPLTSRAVLNKVDLKSFQDTLQINDQAYVSDCYIEGDIDFMWGTGPVFFENVTAKMLTGG